MASPFAEALTQSMISGLDPMNSVVRQFADTQVNTAKVDLVEKKLGLVDKVGKQFSAAVAGGDTGLAAYYDKLMNELTDI